MILPWRINKIIFISDFSHGACFKERMFFKACTLCFIRNNMSGFIYDCHHIIAYGNRTWSHNASRSIQHFFTAFIKAFHFLGNVSFAVLRILTLFLRKLSSIINTNCSVIIYHAGIKANVLFHGCSIRIFNKSKIFIFPCRCITYCNANGTKISAFSKFTRHTVI